MNVSSVPLFIPNKLYMFLKLVTRPVWKCLKKNYLDPLSTLGDFLILGVKAMKFSKN